jgi:hypothetical protein
MKANFKFLATLLAVAGVIDLVMIPFMINAANTHPSSAPPAAATILSGVLGVATLAAIPALAQGRRWAFWVVMIARILDIANSALGAAFGPGVIFHIASVVIILASIPAIVLMVRLNPRRAARAAGNAEARTNQNARATTGA